MTTEAQPSEKKRNIWIWISALLALAAIGVSIWAVQTKSDLDDTEAQLAKTQQELKVTQEQVATMQQDLDGSKQTAQELQDQAERRTALSGAAAIGFKAGYDALMEELGTTSEDLEQNKKDLKNAEQAAADAEKAAEKAQGKAKDANNATEKAQAEAEQAQAEADAANARTDIVINCGKSAVGAFAPLFESENPQDELDAVKKELEDISESCREAFESA